MCVIMIARDVSPKGRAVQIVGPCCRARRGHRGSRQAAPAPIVRLQRVRTAVARVLFVQAAIVRQRSVLLIATWRSAHRPAASKPDGNRSIAMRQGARPPIVNSPRIRLRDVARALRKLFILKTPVIGALVRKPALVDLLIARLRRKSAAVAS